MSRHPGAWSDVIPVRMLEATFADPIAPVQDPEVGIRWGRPSAFTHSAQTQSESPDGTAPNSHGQPFVKNPTKFKRRDDVESIRAPVMWGGTLREMQAGEVDIRWSSIEWMLIPLGQETWAEVKGFTTSSEGAVTTTFKQVLVDRYLTLNTTSKLDGGDSFGTWQVGEMPAPGGG